MLAAARRTHHRVNPAGHPRAARYWRAAQRRTVPHDRPATEEPGMSAIVTWTRRHRLVAFFGLTFLLSWWSWPFYALGLAPTAFFPCGPLVAALAVIGVTEGRAGYRDLGARMIRWRVGWTWWLVAVGTAARRPGRRRRRERRDLGRAGTRPGHDRVVADRPRCGGPVRQPAGRSPRRGARLAWLCAPAAAGAALAARVRRSSSGCSSRSGTCRWWRPACWRRSVCPSRSPSPWSTSGCSTAPAAAS